MWAATIGWDVTAVDYSISGKAKALKLAERRKAKLDYQIQDLAQLNLPENTYDAIALIFVHLSAQIRAKVHNELVKSLKPGGLLIMESFHKNQLHFDSGGPKNAEMLYDSKLISSDFSALELNHLSETQTILSEGEWHKGEAAVVRYVGIKTVELRTR